MKKDKRFLTVKILNKFDKSNKKLQLVRNQILINLNSNIKSYVIASTNDITRLKGRLDLLISKISNKKIDQINIKLINILRLGFYEILYCKKIPNYATVSSLVNLAKSTANKKASGFINFILRKLISETKKRDIFESYKKFSDWNSFPQWIQKRWKKNFGKDNCLLLMNHFNTKQGLYVRINSNIGYEKVLGSLDSNDLSYEIFSQNFIRLEKGTKKLLKSNLFKHGLISIQDPAAGAVVNLLDLKKGDTVLDVCAAPGTKSTFISEIIGCKGKVYAYDSNEQRIETAKSDLSRNGLNNIIWEQKDAKIDIYPTSKKILVDVPCTGTGVIGKKPDIKWRRNPRDINEMSKLQFQILQHMSKFLEIGGIMIYSTCSIEKEENWDVVELFLKYNVNFKLVKITNFQYPEWIDSNGCLMTIPYKHKVSGIFAAKLNKYA